MPAALEDALRKSGVVWVDFGAGPRVAWHLWQDGAVWLVCGGLEQELPGVGAAQHATVTVRGTDAVHRFEADVSAVDPGTQEWASVVPALHEKRLNPPDGEAQPDRWARESLVLRLTPRGR